jgi:2-polyprenyl-3-methyl-5-hydroxy-6-metoxy-1,4-benzoquinol methylase
VEKNSCPSVLTSALQALMIEDGSGTCFNPLRLNYIKEKCGGSLKGKKILDVGCGGGILAESLALEGAIVTGIDMAEAGLEVAKLHFFARLDEFVPVMGALW